MKKDSFLTGKQIFNLGNSINKLLDNRRLVYVLDMNNKESVILYNFLKSIAARKNARVTLINCENLKNISYYMCSNTLISGKLTNEEINTILDSTNNIEVFSLDDDYNLVKQTKKIALNRSLNAKSKLEKSKVTKEELMEDSLSHISDVQRLGIWFMEELIKQLSYHDHTKIDLIDEFYKDFIKAQIEEVDFKKLSWYEKHKEEGHHLGAKVPENVNMLHVLEMIIDCTCAGLTRSDKVDSIVISKETIEKAILNTQKLIIENTVVLDSNEMKSKTKN